MYDKIYLSVKNNKMAIIIGNAGMYELYKYNTNGFI